MTSKPTPPSFARRALVHLLCATITLAPMQRAQAEDIDLFLSSTASSAARPNVLILLDNSANWNSNSQHWPTPPGKTGTFKQGQSELRAIRTVLGELDGANPTVNMGLMMFRSASGTPNRDGGIVRYAIRKMNTTNISGFQQLIGTDAAVGDDTTCADGANTVNFTPNCILKNFSGTGVEQTNSASTSYSGGLFDAFKYFGGYTSPAYAQADAQPPGAANNATNYGPTRYFSGDVVSRMDAAGYNLAMDSYALGSDATENACAKNYIIFIGNGFPSLDTGGTLIANVNTGTTPALPTQLPMQNFTTIVSNVSHTLPTDTGCKSATACAADALATYGTDYDSYSCSGGTTVASSPVFIGTASTCQSQGTCQSVTAPAAAAALPTPISYSTYSCTGGNAIAGGSSTLASLVCETASACALRAPTALPGFASYSCGSQVDTRTATATDAVCETQALCQTSSGPSLLPGYGSYVCSGGTVTATTDNATDSATVCHDLAACVSAAAVQFTPANGYVSWACSGGSDTRSSTITGTDNVCHASCAAAGAAYFGAPPAGQTASYSCPGGTGTSCGSGDRRNWQVTASYLCGAGKFGQTMSGTKAGCGGSNKINQLVTATATACSGSNHMYTITGSTTACTDLVNQNMYGINTCQQSQTVTGTKEVWTVTPLSTFRTPTGSEVNYADEWAQLLYNTDVMATPGQQNVVTYTIDVFKDQQDTKQTALLFNMARNGGGKYFQATNETAIIDALRQILIEIQSVNSVFASASLPINATNRSQNENQVFIGMFRPDASAGPRWYGNLKRYQIAQFGQEFKLADSSTPPIDAVSNSTGFIQPCATSFWTQDSGAYWFFNSGSSGNCTSTTFGSFSDAPDGPAVEKGAVAEVLRRGNNPPATAGTQFPPAGPNRTLYTCMGNANCCTGTCGASPATQLMPFNATNVSKTQLGNASMTDLERDNIINYTIGYDIADANHNVVLPVTPTPPGFDGVSDVRPTVHGDVAHSRPLPVNFGSSRGVELFYGANDGTFRAVRGSDGKELWAFFASEQHNKLKRLTDNSPVILYTGMDSPPADATAKDYFFDGSAGLFQNADNSKVWVFPSMRRGGRMVYAFDVSTSTPTLKWRKGCSDPNTSDTASCSASMTAMGQSWSVPSVVLVKGYGTDLNDPLIIMGGGYDSCEDQDVAPNTACSSGRKGNVVYVLNANTGDYVASFATLGSVPSDITLVDRDFDGFADHAYVGDTLGNLYRIDFVDPATLSPRASTAWTINRIGYSTGGNRKFLFGPAVLPSAGKLYVTNVSGDRERPLVTNYPSDSSKGGPVTNRAYMLIDDLSVTTNPSDGVITGTAVDLDSSTLANMTSTSNFTCVDAAAAVAGKRGWRFNLNAGTGEQGVTSTLIFGGLVFFSTNRPVTVVSGACRNDLGEARGYAVNLLTSSGAVGTEGLCGTNRSGVFTGGGLPPSPVTGVVPVGGRPITVMIGGIQRSGGASSPIGSQRVRPAVTQVRSRLYWYRDGDK